MIHLMEKSRNFITSGAVYHKNDVLMFADQGPDSTYSYMMVKCVCKKFPLELGVKRCWSRE